MAAFFRPLSIRFFSGSASTIASKSSEGNEIKSELPVDSSPPSDAPNIVSASDEPVAAPVVEELDFPVIPGKELPQTIIGDNKHSGAIWFDNLFPLRLHSLDKRYLLVNTKKTLEVS
jgi:hypothetical protein